MDHCQCHCPTVMETNRTASAGRLGNLTFSHRRWQGLQHALSNAMTCLPNRISRWSFSRCFHRKAASNDNSRRCVVRKKPDLENASRITQVCHDMPECRSMVVDFCVRQNGTLGLYVRVGALIGSHLALSTRATKMVDIEYDQYRVGISKTYRLL
jgi:hypothetical protein